jgi:hypothetical protein
MPPAGRTGEPWPGSSSICGGGPAAIGTRRLAGPRREGQGALARADDREEAKAEAIAEPAGALEARGLICKFSSLCLLFLAFEFPPAVIEAPLARENRPQN